MGVFALVSAVNTNAQENETQTKIRQRVENFFAAIRAEKWDEVAEFVIVSTDKKSPETCRRMNILENDSAEEINKKVGEWFKGLYGILKPGKIISVTVFPTDSTLAGIGYMHGDKDGFIMRLYKGEWYYTFDREIESAAEKENTE